MGPMGLVEGEQYLREGGGVGGSKAEGGGRVGGLGGVGRCCGVLWLEVGGFGYWY